MAEYLVTYDVEEPHQAKVKENLTQNHFFPFMIELVAESVAVRLPNTTVLVSAASAADAQRKFLAAAPAGIAGGASIITRYAITRWEDYVVFGPKF